MQGTRASLEIAQAASIRSTKGNWYIVVQLVSTVCVITTVRASFYADWRV